ncbi:MAG: uroporphyrinogen-III synthase [Gemmatimonadota bacterium]
MHALLEGRKSPQGALTDATPEPRGRPLAGLRVLVTRPTAPSEPLSVALCRAGAIVDPVPTIRIVDPPDLAPLREAADAFEAYDWVVLTSANGVERLAVALSERLSGSASLRSCKLAVIGPATAAAARVLGAEPLVVPAVHRGEALADALLMAVPDLAGRRILLARASEARPVLPARLRAAGAIVDDVPAYATRVDESSREALTALVDDGAVDWVTFTASSTVHGFVELVGPRAGGARAAAIGPITAETVRVVGLPEPVVAEDATAEGLVEAIVRAEAA